MGGENHMNQATIRKHRRNERLNAVARRLFNDANATWADVEKTLIIPTAHLGTATEETVLNELSSKLKTFSKNLDNNHLRHEYMPAQDLANILKTYPPLARGAAAKNYKRKR